MRSYCWKSVLNRLTSRLFYSKSFEKSFEKLFKKKTAWTSHNSKRIEVVWEYAILIIDRNWHPEWTSMFRCSEGIRYRTSKKRKHFAYGVHIMDFPYGRTSSFSANSVLTSGLLRFEEPIEASCLKYGRWTNGNRLHCSITSHLVKLKQQQFIMLESSENNPISRKRNEKTLTSSTKLWVCDLQVFGGVLSHEISKRSASY